MDHIVENQAARVANNIDNHGNDAFKRRLIECANELRHAQAMNREQEQNRGIQNRGIQQLTFDDNLKQILKSNDELHKLRVERHLEFERRSLLGNPSKLLTLSAGVMLLDRAPKIAAIPLTLLAGRQGYHDFINLKQQDSLLGAAKYGAGLLSDAAMAAGAFGFLTDKVPVRYKAPMVLGGFLARAVLDFLP